MTKNPAPIAWLVLITSCTICIATAIAVPLGIRHFINHARISERVSLEVQSGSLGVTLAGRGDTLAIDGMRDEIPERTIITTDYAAGRLIIAAPQENLPVVATVQLYDNTRMTILSARSPRFAHSDLPHEIELSIQSGRVCIHITDEGARETIVNVHTPHGVTTLTQGNFELRVNATTEITVRHGQADVIKNDLSARLVANEQAIIDQERIIGPSAAPSNLIANGNFEQDIEPVWVPYHDEEESLPGERDPVQGTVNIVTWEDRPVAIFDRTGERHAEVGIRQDINYEVGELKSLELRLAVHIEGHNVPLCGTKGSECPVMARIVYVDANEGEQEWIQGFYMEDTGVSGNPSVCVTCTTRNLHIQVRPETWYPYLSPNLIPLLSQDGQAPSLIKSIDIYASGHSYQAMVGEVELIAQE